ncbi:MAG: hypothetical protein LBT79_06855 [Elusimicrobiota bacterium]|jgi:uncharacterized protein with ParB-like and HNH nuclease domain|nr:hypothetical protein [Elusimicrobiota bacterium]
MEISPEKQNINNVFSNTHYYIDFYQRQYKWGKEPVIRLFDDVFDKFYENDRIIRMLIRKWLIIIHGIT